jgi:uncharacterized SAM-binding protein YcdF (DUF218 family)
VLPGLKYRLDKTIDYYQRNPQAVIFVTGGQGSREDVPEAEVMAHYLIQNGIPSEKVFREENSLSTWENMKFSKPLLDQYFNGDYTAVIITSDFHQYRSERFALQAGMEVTRLPAQTPWYSLLTSYIRECAAVIKLWLFKV